MKVVEKSPVLLFGSVGTKDLIEHIVYIDLVLIRRSRILLYFQIWLKNNYLLLGSFNFAKYTLAPKTVFQWICLYYSMYHLADSKIECMIQNKCLSFFEGNLIFIFHFSLITYFYRYISFFIVWNRQFVSKSIFYVISIAGMLDSYWIKADKFICRLCSLRGFFKNIYF